jgi:hypothetical protein
MTKRRNTVLCRATMTQRRSSVFRLTWTALVVVVTSAPYVFNWLTTPAGYRYTWIVPPYPEDSFGYMAWAQQAAHGALLFKIKYTALPHEAFLFHPFFLFCGWISALLSCDIAIIFWVAKAIGTGVFLAAFYRYIDYLGLNRFQATAASILVGISSGVGGFLAWAGWLKPSSLPPADIWMPEVSTFFALLWNPLFPFSLTLMLLSIYWLDRGTRDERARDFWLSGFASGVMILIHPYALPLLFTLAAIVTIVRKRLKSLRYLFRYFAAALPFAIYVVLVSRLNPLVAKHSVVGVMKSPPLIMYVSGFGLLLLFGIGGLIVARRTLLKGYWHIILWFLLSVALAYGPFWFQRKLIFGAHMPLCILAAIAFDMILAKWAPGRRRWILIGAAVILLPLVVTTPLYLLFSQRADVKANADGAYFLSDDMVEGLKVLKQQSKPNDVVFATPATSRLIPVFSGNTTVWGHWAMSVDRGERERWFGNLFTNVDDTNRSREFWSDDIQFIFADGALKQRLEQSPFGWGAILRDARKVFENASVVIYQRQPTS